MDSFLIDSPAKATFVALGIGAVILLVILWRGRRRK
jgi:hypothetical protein